MKISNGVNKKTIIQVSNKMILRRQALAEGKEDIRLKLVVIAKKLAVTAKEKENIRKKLVITAKEKENVRKKLAVFAKEKENVRRKLVITAARLAATARKLMVTAKEKESVRLKLVLVAKKLKESRETLEKKVFERTKDLEQARSRDEAILVSIGDGLVAVDKEGKILIVNKAFENLVGWKEKEVLGKLLIEIVPREDETGNIVSFKERILNKILSTTTTTTTTTSDWYYIRKDKTRFLAASIITPFILENKVIGAVEVFRDITKEKDIDIAKTEFVSLASHQLRTPLTDVSWHTEMILNGDLGKVVPEQKKYLKKIYQSNKRMIELVNTLLDVSRLELGTFKVTPSPTNVIVLAQSVLDEQKSEIEKKKLIIVKKLSKDVPIFSVDPKLLRMVFQNLLANSVEYTPEKGMICFEIALDTAKENILITVADTGYGIPKNQQDKIFTKFFRADNIRKKDTDGTGLGLYIIKSIVENSGGKIWFESEENKGSTFHVTLNLTQSLQKN